MIALSWQAIVVGVAIGTSAVFACLTAVLAKLSSDEVSGWIPVWSLRLLNAAVAIIPPDHRERYRKEWLAELAAFRGRPVSGLRFSWRLRRRAHSMHNALLEGDGLAEVFDPEAPPVEVRPLDAETIAAIVRRAVDRTKPRGVEGDELFEFLMETLSGLEIGDLPNEITRGYFGAPLDWRRAGERSRRVGPSPTFFSVRPGTKAKSPLWEIERDAARRQRASELRRRTNSRRRFPFSLWL